MESLVTVKTIGVRSEQNQLTSVLIWYADGEKHISTPEGLKVGPEGFPMVRKLRFVIETAPMELIPVGIWFTTLSFILEKADRWFVLQKRRTANG